MIPNNTLPICNSSQTYSAWGTFLRNSLLIMQLKIKKIQTEKADVKI